MHQRDAKVEPKTDVTHTLDAFGIEYRIKLHSAPEHTAEQTARERDAPLNRIVETMVVKVPDGEYAIALVPGERKLNLRKLLAIHRLLQAPSVLHGNVVYYMAQDDFKKLHGTNSLSLACDLSACGVIHRAMQNAFTCARTATAIYNERTCRWDGYTMHRAICVWAT